MKQYNTRGIVLTRTDFGEADRIITFLTDDYGKVKAIAKGVRRSKAKLAGSVEPFGVSELTAIKGRRDIDTLISARLLRNYGQIVKDIERTKAAYEFMRLLDKATEDQPEEAYFTLLDKALAALNNSEITVELTDLWFKMQLLKLSGHAPNLKTDAAGKKLETNQKYNFNFDKMCFSHSQNGLFSSSVIKFMRLAQAAASAKVLGRVQNIYQGSIDQCLGLINSLASLYFHSN